MSYSNPINLSDSHPLSWRYIESLQKQFSNLDKNDLCFPIYYRQVRIYCEETKLQLICHSITALPKYSNLSFEELRCFNHNKINNKTNDSYKTNLNILKKQKYFFIDSINKSKIYYDFTQEEKNEIEIYFRNFTLNSDDSFNSLLDNYCHNNFNFYNLVKSINKNTYLQNNQINNNNILLNNQNNLTNLNSNGNIPNTFNNQNFTNSFINKNINNNLINNINDNAVKNFDSMVNNNITSTYHNFNNSINSNSNSTNNMSFNNFNSNFFNNGTYSNNILSNNQSNNSLQNFSYDQSKLSSKNIFFFIKI